MNSRTHNRRHRPRRPHALQRARVPEPSSDRSADPDRSVESGAAALRAERGRKRTPGPPPDMGRRVGALFAAGGEPAWAAGESPDAAELGAASVGESSGAGASGGGSPEPAGSSSVLGAAEGDEAAGAREGLRGGGRDGLRGSFGDASGGSGGRGASGVVEPFGASGASADAVVSGVVEAGAGPAGAVPRGGVGSSSASGGEAVSSSVRGEGRTKRAVSDGAVRARDLPPQATDSLLDGLAGLRGVRCLRRRVSSAVGELTPVPPAGLASAEVGRLAVHATRAGGIEGPEVAVSDGARAELSGEPGMSKGAGRGPGKTVGSWHAVAGVTSPSRRIPAGLDADGHGRAEHRPLGDESPAGQEGPQSHPEEDDEEPWLPPEQRRREAVAAARAAVRRSKARNAAARGARQAEEATPRGGAKGAQVGPGARRGVFRETPGAAEVRSNPAANRGSSRAGGGAGESGPGRKEPGDSHPSGGVSRLPAESEAAQTATLPAPAGLRRLSLWLRVRCGMEVKTVVAVAVVLLVAVGFAVHHFWSGRPQPVAAPSRMPEESGDGASSASPGSAPATGTVGGGPKGGPSAAGGEVTVDVAGDVRKPGLRTLPTGSRVEDALKAAGGLTPGAETEGLNRARPLVDGEQIVAGGPPQAQPGAEPSGAASGPGAAPDGAPGAPISLGSATAEQLETLPGVGPALAQRILDYREQQGGFASVEQLQEVSGIGERRFADIQPKVVP